MSSAKEIWRGDLGETVRVLKVADDDCIAEVLVVRSDDSRILSVDRDAYSVDKDGAWGPATDEVASHAYMAALLEADRKLNLAVSMMGSREAADFLAALEGKEA